MKIYYDTLYCIGDSHISFFSGRNDIQPAWPLLARDTIPSFLTYRLRAVLAYRLPDFGSTMQGKEKLLQLIKILPPGARLLLSFGEVDCRVHLIKQSEKQNRPIEEVVNECVGRYFGEVLNLKKDFKPMIWGVIPSSPTEEILDPRYPHYGAPAARNHVTQLFNAELLRLCTLHDIPFFSIYSALVYADGTTNTAYYIDQIHLSQRAMPIAVRELIRAVPDFRMRFFRNNFLSRFSPEMQAHMIRIRSWLATFFYLTRQNLWSGMRAAIDRTIGLERVRSYRDTLRRMF